MGETQGAGRPGWFGLQLPARPVDAVTYLLYRSGEMLALGLPDVVAGPVAIAAGRVMGVVMRGRREMLARHVRRLYGPGLPEREVRGRIDAALDSYGRYWLESFRLPRVVSNLDTRFTPVGLEAVDVALAAGKGAIFALPHLGNWDAGGAYMASVRGYQMTVVVEPAQPPELFEWFMGHRRSLGMEVLPLGPQAGSGVLRALSHNRVVCLVSDRNIGPGGIEVEFFGERTRLPAGPAVMALRSGAPLFPVAVYFTPDGGHLGLIRPPLPVERHGRLRDDVTRVTQALAVELEALILRAPEQWHMLQPNWPSDYDSIGQPRPGDESQSM